MMETVAGTSPAMSNCSTSSSPSKYITVVDVYDLAESINRDFESLAEQFGKDPIESIVRKVICALETLEALAKNNDRDNAEIMDLQKGIERLQQEKIQRLRDKDTLERHDVSDLEENYKKEIEDLCRAVKSLQAENRSMKRKISTNVADDRGRSVSPEQNDFREQDLQAMLDLRQLQIQQKDQIKDLQRDINTYSCEVDNLQNNIEKLLRQNKELLRKNASLQKQGRILVQERAELLRRLQATEETNFQLRKVLNETSRACKDLESQRQFERENDNSPGFRCVNSGSAPGKEPTQSENAGSSSEQPSKDVFYNLSEKSQKSRTEQTAMVQSPAQMSSPSTSSVPCEEEISEECVVYGPINREPEEKLHPWKYERKQSGVRRFFRFFKELNTSGV
uniref:RH1 domain-containing protein n=1 Tax=Ditylenchus dipsaci TaxID=166011 RepID=A0A915CUX5_9BILA